MRQHSSAGRLSYPETRTVEQVDHYHGVPVRDPYRWLEDLDSAETHEWILRQNRVTSEFLGGMESRGSIQRRLLQLWNHERYGIPFRRGGRLFYMHNNGLQNQHVLYVIDGPGAEPRTLLDPNALSPDGTVALTGTSVSRDGRRLAYSLSESGSDWQTWRVRDVESGADLPDALQWSKFSSAAWTPDGAGFFYSRYAEPRAGDEFEAATYYQKLYYHRVGTPQSEDRLIYERPDQKEWGFSGEVSHDGNWLVITIWQGTVRKNRIFVRDLRRPDAPVIQLLNDFDAAYDYVTNRGGEFLFFTTNAAPRGRVIALRLENPAPVAWREVVPQRPETLESATCVGGRLLCQYLRNASAHVTSVDPDSGDTREVRLPGIGTAFGFHGRPEDADTFYMFSSFTDPGTVCRYDVAAGQSEIFRRPRIHFDAADMVTEQVFYPSRDGTRVPMFLVYRRSLRKDGSNPVYLTGYGGFNVSITPAYSAMRIVWLEMGGMLAVPNLRGGGEYGEAWHHAGAKLRKQNVFDDCIAAAEWLVESGYTSPGRVSVIGGSNGGLLVGACLTQRPELFGAAVPHVGVMDMLRFHLFTIGWAWASDYGTADNPEEFRALLAYSPLHNVKPGRRYPPTLVMTGDHDDRVVPSHSFKFAAALQAAQAGDAPVLLRVDMRSGHGAGKPVMKMIEESADELAFLAHALGVPVPILESE